jgi:hypothetical protein
MFAENFESIPTKRRSSYANSIESSKPRIFNTIFGFDFDDKALEAIACDTESELDNDWLFDNIRCTKKIEDLKSKINKAELNGDIYKAISLKEREKDLESYLLQNTESKNKESKNKESKNKESKNKDIKNKDSKDKDSKDSIAYISDDHKDSESSLDKISNTKSSFDKVTNIKSSNDKIIENNSSLRHNSNEGGTFKQNKHRKYSNRKISNK